MSRGGGYFQCVPLSPMGVGVSESWKYPGKLKKWKSLHLREYWKFSGKLQHTQNKKVLLRERKRHTARRVVSTPSVVLTGYPPPSRYPPSWTWQGTPPQVSAPWHSGKCCKALWDMGTPPLGVDKLTKWNYYLPVVLRTRAVKMPFLHYQLQTLPFGRLRCIVFIFGTCMQKCDD